MRLAIAGLMGASLMLGGCQTAFVKEVRYPGGYPGYLLDKRTIDSSQAKSVQLLRAAMIVAMASRMATATIKDGKDADGFADYLAAATDEINYTAANIYKVKPAGTEPCKVGDAESAEPCRAYYINFESDIPLLEARVVRLMLAALPENRAREFLKDVAKGDVIGAAWSAIRTVAESADGLRRSAAVFRSNLELAAVLQPCGQKFDQRTDTVSKAAGCFALPEETLFSDKRVLLTQPVGENAFHSVMLIAQTACARLPLNSDGNITDKSKQRNEQCERVRFSPAYRPVKIS